MRAAAPLIPHPPSKLQLEFLALDAEECLFGGAAGAGKSDVALMLVLRHVHVPGYAGAVFRRTKVDADKPDAPLARAREWLRPAMAAGLCRWDEELRSFVFKTAMPDGTPGPPSQIHFGYLQHEADQDRYQGSAFQVIVVDELTQWPEGNYLFLFSRLRYSETLKIPAGYSLPLLMRATSNPGGRGHEWVKARFIEKARHVLRNSDVREDCRARRFAGEGLPSPRIYVSPPSKEALEVAQVTGRPAQGAHFVPAFVQDNPFMTGDALAAYRANLVRLGPTKRAQLEWGDWDAVSDGGFFTPDHFEIIERVPLDQVIRFCRSWDFAATVPKDGSDPDFTVGAKVGVFREQGTKRQRVIVPHVKRGRWSPGDTDLEVKRVAQRDGKRVPVLVEQEPGAAGKRGVAHFKTGLLAGWSVHGIRKTGPKAEYWEPLASVTDGANDLGAPMLLVREGPGDEPWIEAFRAELCAIPIGHDDQADSAAQGYAWLTEDDGGAEHLRALAK
jgi:phage terminase large subunit-like protein